MRVTQNIDLVQPTIQRHRLITGWSIVIGLSLLELVAVLYGSPSVLLPYPAITAFVAAVGEWIPVVQSFGRCAARFDAGSGLMLALNAVFFPLKLAALYYAHPKKITNPNKGWRGVFGSLYVFLIATVALVPTLIFFGGWISPNSETGLATLRQATSALCAGGTGAFIAWTLRAGVALAAAYVSVVIFIGLFRRQPSAVQVER